MTEVQFQSTPSARRATKLSTCPAAYVTYFNPRPPRGGRLRGLRNDKSSYYFNPRPPRGGRRGIPTSFPSSSYSFQSTPSARRATYCSAYSPLRAFISIHALREEGDIVSALYSSGKRISIHALREEGDYSVRTVLVRQAYFNPRPPRGGRHASRGLYPPPCYFNPRPPRGGRPGLYGSLNHNRHFNPRPPRGGRPNSGNSRGQKLTISIHALREEGDCGFVWLPQSQ